MDAALEREWVQRLGATPPGAELHGLLAEAAQLPMTAALASAVLEASTRLLASVEALRLTATAWVAGPAPARADEDFADAEVAVATGLSTQAAQRLIGLARSAALGPLAPLHAELAAGRTSYVHLLVADDAVAGLDPATAQEVLAAVRPHAALPVARFRDRVRRAVRRADAAAELRRRRRARDDRRVTWWADADGLGHLHVVGDLDRVARAWEAIRAQADAAPRVVGDGRTADARRADAALDLLAGAAPTAAGGRGEILAVVAADALADRAAERRVGELVGVGPVLAGTIRSLARDHAVRRVVVDETGAVLDASAVSRPRRGATTTSRVEALLRAPVPGPPEATSGYVPAAALARFVELRDRRCSLPGCRAAATRCDLDHAVPYPHGPTSTANLGALCRRHHRLKTLGRWTLRRDGGQVTWTTASGRTLRRGPEDYRWVLA